MSSTLPVMTHPDFPARHAFFSRKGGVSNGLYNSLNMRNDGYDNPEHVTENLRRGTAYFSSTPAQLCTLKQVHGTHVITLSSSPAHKTEGDAMVTRTAGLLLGILTADCCPVLFHDSVHQVIGAAHAGWKGALGGIVVRTLDHMVALGATLQTIHVALGPTIGQASYEVDQLFYQRFLEQSPDHAVHFIPGKREGHHYFDLPGYITTQLKHLPLAGVHVLRHDTCAEADLFFSYRRNVLQQETLYGCQLSAISL